MAKIKSYTDLEQSKKLSEILPIESADMYYEKVCNLPKAIVGNYILHNQCMEDKDYKKLSNPVISPAWSLASLLGVLPDRICLDNEKYYLNFKKDKVEYLGPVTWDGQKCVKSEANIIIDAAFEMILKLHELKML